MADWPAFAVTVDLVVLTVRAGDAQRRCWSAAASRPTTAAGRCPAGSCSPDEDLPDAAAARAAPRRPALAGPAGHLEQLRHYGAPGRDPRGRVVTVAYLALLPDLPAPVAGTDAAGAGWRAAAGAAAAGLRPRPDPAPTAWSGPAPSWSTRRWPPRSARPSSPSRELREVYEAVWGTALDPRNFHRKVTGTPGFVVAAGRSTAGDRGRPAQLFRRGPANLLHPPMLPAPPDPTPPPRAPRPAPRAPRSRASRPAPRAPRPAPRAPRHAPRASRHVPRAPRHVPRATRKIGATSLKLLHTRPNQQQFQGSCD